jgi:putative peptide zinc metalloprotease protein
MWPKMRDDLILKTAEKDGTLYLMVKDPKSNRFFRLEKTESLIAKELETPMTTEEIQKKIEEKYSISLKKETLETFLHNLKNLQLLEGDEVTLPKGKRSLFIKIAAVNPQPFLDKIAPHAGVFFTIPFLIASLCLIFFSGILFTFHIDQLYFFTAFDTFSAAVGTVLPLYTLLILVTVGHELAHAVTCTYFGAPVTDAGFGIYLTFPVFYVNVTETLFFEEKYKKVAVFLAGPYFELVLWALLVLLWYFLSSLQVFFSLFLVLLVVKILLTFNPLIKFDGYYILEDILEIPNLRRRSFEYLLSLLSHGKGRKTKEVKLKVIFVVYSLASSTFMLAVLYAVSIGAYKIVNASHPEWVPYVLLGSGIAVAWLLFNFGRLIHRYMQS